MDLLELSCPRRFGCGENKLVINYFHDNLINKLMFRGCFLTSSLIATLAMTLQIPLAMLLDVILRNKIYPLYFYLGSIPMFLSLIFVSFLMKYDDFDPVLKFFKALYRKFFWNCRRTNIVRFVD